MKGLVVMAQHWQELIPIDRYVVSVNGLIHDFDRKVMTFLYQPLIGTTSFSLYMTLWAELEENRLWSEPSSHHGLMTIMGLNLKEIYEARLRLEGMGLITTYVRNEGGERAFIYQLQPPLTPAQFFLDGMLNIYLYRKIGKKQFARLKRFFSDQKTVAHEGYQNVTKAFQDIYASASPNALKSNQETAEELAEGERQEFIGRKENSGIQIEQNTFNFELLETGLSESLVPKKALTKKVKEAISNLGFLYEIDAIQMKNIVLSAMTEHDEINLEELRKSARDWYQFNYQDSLPSLIERTHPPLYQSKTIEPQTQEDKLIHYFDTTSPLKFLSDLAGGAEASNADIKIIEDVMFNQKLLPGVINVLIHYVMLKMDMKLTKGYVEKLASHWARKEVKTVKAAMELALNEHKQYQQWASGENKNKKKTSKKPIRTELLPDWFNEESNKQEVKQKDVNNKDSDFETRKRALEEKIKNLRK
ncbi:replication initiation and membrane attachment protein [Bacillus sp. 1NLA3E]|nr:replication initiation and membrane attachment protein [Bacillus sp. 1NLA3E]